MARIYLASSWRNTHQPEIVKFLRRHEHDVYDFRNPSPLFGGFRWSDIGLEIPCKAEAYRTALTLHPIAARGYMSDFRAMEWADTCVLLLPCGRSAHLEAGWFAGARKRLIIYTKDNEEPELMALMANHIVISDEELVGVLS